MTTDVSNLRGGGEMMTRSPVMVTLTDGQDHTANFRDSSKIYQLSSESDVSNRQFKKYLTFSSLLEYKNDY